VYVYNDNNTLVSYESTFDSYNYVMIMAVIKLASFSVRLKELRKAKKVKQYDVAYYLGISERGYQNYEIGKREPNHETTIKLADYFQVSVDYLLGRKNYWQDADGYITVRIPPNLLSDEIIKMLKE